MSVLAQPVCGSDDEWPEKSHLTGAKPPPMDTILSTINNAAPEPAKMKFSFGTGHGTLDFTTPGSPGMIYMGQRWALSTGQLVKIKQHLIQLEKDEGSYAPLLKRINRELGLDPNSDIPK
jgi:hypothetical protein